MSSKSTTVKASQNLSLAPALLEPGHKDKVQGVHPPPPSSIRGESLNGSFQTNESHKEVRPVLRKQPIHKRVTHPHPLLSSCKTDSESLKEEKKIS